MAKTLREELAALGGAKKPNVFYKGLNTDVDESFIGNDQYSDAVNVNLDSKDGNLASLQSLKGNSLSTTLRLSLWKIEPTTNNSGRAWYFSNSSTAWNGNNRSETPGTYLNKLRFEFMLPDLTNYEFSDGNSYIEIDVSPESVATTSVAPSYADKPKTSYNSAIYTNDEMILITAELLSRNSVFTSAFDIVIGAKSTGAQTTSTDIHFIPKGDQLPHTTQNAVEVTSYYRENVDGTGAQYQNSSLEGYDTYYSFGANRNLRPLGFASFTGFICAICYVHGTQAAIVKLITDSTGQISKTEVILFADLGISSISAKLFVEKIEENENYKRIYWTDGVNPVRTYNLEASYKDAVSYDEISDFNLFPKNSLPVFSLDSVNVGGSVNCGSWSYCYRLTTQSGARSSVSPLTNPIPLAKTNYGGLINTVVGGNISESSNKNVRLKLSGIDQSFDSIELIGIHYLDNLGSAVFYSIKTENIAGQTSITIVHTGNEPATVVTAESVLSIGNVWDIAQTLCIKDNRLFAGNLKNQSDNLFSNTNTFNIKSYDHTFYQGKTSTDYDSYNWSDATVGSGSYVTYDGSVNPSLYNPDLYKHPTKHSQSVSAQNTTGAYRFVKQNNSHQPILGAESNGFEYAFANKDSDEEGIDSIRITYRLKPFDLDEIGLGRFQDLSGTSTNKANVPYYGSFAESERGNEYNNYKSPIFAEKYVGYMRDEVYRFGIQFYDRKGNSTFTYVIGDLRMPSIEDDYRHFNGPASGTVHGGGNSGYPDKYILKGSDGKGHVLHLRAEVILSPSTREKISGFDIVRAERSDADRRIVTAGLLNNTLQYADHADNLTMQNKLGLDKISVFAPNTGFGMQDWQRREAEVNPVYTIDSPEVIFDRLNYIASGTDELRIANHLQCDRVLRPNNYHQLYDGHATNNQRIYWSNDNAATQINSDYVVYGMPPKVSYITAPNLPFLSDNSMIAKYHCNGSTTHKLSWNLPKQNYADATQNNRKPIAFAKTVEAGEIVDGSLISSPVTFQNSAVVYDKTVQNDSSFKFLAVNLHQQGNDYYVKNNGGFIQNGNRTLLLSLGATDYFNFAVDGNIFSSSVDGFSTKLIKKGGYLPSKAYVKIIRQFDNNSGQYGGNSDSALLNTRWISTGSYQKVEKNTNLYDFHVYGGDTYINMFSLSKYHEETVAADTDKLTVQAVVFPVESSINLDLRSGTFTGNTTPRLEFEDDYNYDSSYSAINSTRSFPAVNPNIPQVTDLSNVVAASNIKIAGTNADAFSNFDSNETFEVDRNYGPIKNLSKLNDTVYCLQDKATSVLSINTRALIQSQDGSAISIASAVGTGNVIERNDYLSTEYGSQHIHNPVSTDNGLYWVDALNASICAITTRNIKTVVNLTESLSCSKPLSILKNLKVNDNSLLTTGVDGGGIDIAYDNYLNEINFGISYYDGTGVRYVSLSYNDALNVFTSKRSYSTLLNISHEGYNFSVGRQIIFDELNRVKIFVSGGGDINEFYGSNGSNPYVKIVNNEEPNSLKTYDKVTVYTKENTDSGIFTKFAYSTDIDTEEVLDLSTSDIDKIVVNKQIVPVYVTKRLKGNHLSIKLEQVVSGSSFLDFNLRSVTTHYRKTII